MSDDLEAIDAALLHMRRLWAPQTSGRLPEGVDRGVDLSTVLIVHALGTDPAAAALGVLAQRLAVAPATASRLVDRAVEGGYVRKSSSPGDARRVSLSLTRSGEDLLARSQAWRARYLAEVLADWSAQDVAVFARLLGRFAAEIAAAPPGPLER